MTAPRAVAERVKRVFGETQPETTAAYILAARLTDGSAEHVFIADVLALADAVLAGEAEIERLRGFAEAVVTRCEWGPSAEIKDDEDVNDAAEQFGILVERPHAQPCADEQCECDGSPTLLYFAWKATPATTEETK